MLSGNFLFVAFIAYLVATLLFGGAIKGNQMHCKQAQKNGVKLPLLLQLLVFLHNLGYFITRWIYTGHAPVSNMFEFTTAFGMFLVAAFILIYFMYKVTALGLVALPIALINHCLCSNVPNRSKPISTVITKSLVNNSRYYSSTWSIDFSD